MPELQLQDLGHEQVKHPQSLSLSDPVPVCLVTPLPVASADPGSANLQEMDYRRCTKYFIMGRISITHSSGAIPPSPETHTRIFSLYS
jgi:hypothetical protein